MAWGAQCCCVYSKTKYFWLHMIGSPFTYYLVRRIYIVARSIHRVHHVRPFGRMYQHGSCWVAFREIWHWELLWKAVMIIPFGWSGTKILGIYAKIEGLLLLPATLNCHNSTFCEWIGIRLLGKLWRWTLRKHDIMLCYACVASFVLYWNQQVIPMATFYNDEYVSSDNIHVCCGSSSGMPICQ